MALPHPQSRQDEEGKKDESCRAGVFGDVLKRTVDVPDDRDGEDEFLVMIAGQAVLHEDDGATILRAGDCAAWPKGSTNGHHLRNESDQDCVFIVVGGGTNTGGGYSDIDMVFTPEGTYARKDGTPYGETKRPA